jgi:hypothetical protein
LVPHLLSPQVQAQLEDWRLVLLRDIRAVHVLQGTTAAGRNRHAILVSTPLR